MNFTSEDCRSYLVTHVQETIPTTAMSLQTRVSLCTDHICRTKAIQCPQCVCRSFHMSFVDHPESSARKFYPKKPLNQDPKTTGNHLVSHGVPILAVVENPCVFRGFFPQGVSTTSQFLLHAGGRGSVWLEVRI